MEVTMKKILILFIIFIINIYSYPNKINENNKNKISYIKGSVIFNNFVLPPLDVEISLYDEDMILIQKEASIIGNNFYFINPVPNKSYKLLIKYNSIEKSKSFDYYHNNMDIGTIYLNPSRPDYNKNVFYSFILVFAISINILFLKIFHHKSKLTHENPLILSVIFYTIADFLVLTGNIIGYSKESLGSHLTFLSVIPHKIFYIFILVAVIKYIKASKNLFFKGLLYFYIIWQVVSLPSILSFISQAIFEKLLIMNQYSFNLLYGSLLANSFNYIVFLLSILITIGHYLYCTKGELNRNELKYYFFFIIGLLVVEFLSFTSFSKKNVRFFSIYFENFELFAFVIIISIVITNNIGYKYTKKINLLQVLMEKILKYFILFNIVYNMLGVFESPTVSYLFLLGFFLSDLLAFISKKFLGKNKNLINKISSQLLFSNTEEDFQLVLVENLGDFNKIKNLKYIFLEKEEDINKYVIKNYKTKVMRKESFKDEYRQYDYLVKTIFNDKLIGFIFLDTNNKLIPNQTLDFLMALSDSFPLIVKTIRVNQLKNKLDDDHLNRNISKCKNLTESLMLNQELAKLILLTDSKEKIDKLATEIINQNKGVDTHE